jgi:hypothetical protein
MAPCRNPECRNGFTPGVIAAGRGNAKIPIVGATMRWGWVNCRACNPKDKDPAYVHVQRLPAEIQERARMADSKSTYDQSATQRKQLEALKAATPLPTAPAVATPSSATTDKLLAQMEKLTDQVTELLAENRELRRKLEVRDSQGVVDITDKPTRRRIRKKGASDDENSTEGKRSLS